MGVLTCSRVARKRRLEDEDIASALLNGDDSEDGLDFDDDSLADPDFIPDLETFEDEPSELDIDVDSLIETLKDNHESPSLDAETADLHISVPQSSTAPTNQPKTAKQSQTKKNYQIEFTLEEEEFTVKFRAAQVQG